MGFGCSVACFVASTASDLSDKYAGCAKPKVVSISASSFANVSNLASTVVLLCACPAARLSIMNASRGSKVVAEDDADSDAAGEDLAPADVDTSTSSFLSSSC